MYSKYSKYWGFDVYSMNKTGGGRKMFITRANEAGYDYGFCVDSYTQKFWSHRPRDTSSKNSFGDKPVREELILHC